MIDTKNFILNNSLKYIQSKTDYSEVKLKEIKYGLEAIYLTITKFIFVCIISLILGILKEMIIFTLLFNILRLTAFGLHATKTWICLVSTTILFIGLPILCMHVSLQIYIKIICCSIGILLMFKNSPADTKKKPIVSKKLRVKYKYISVIISIVYSFACILTNNNFISNSLMLSLILQNLMISPLIYRIFRLPYNNYIEYLKKHPEYSE